MIRGELKVVVDDAALQALIASPDGPVAKELARLGGRIEGTARELASGELVNVRTGRYRSSLSWKLFTQGAKVGVAIGSGVFYSEFLEFGTRRMQAKQVIQTAARRNGIRI